MYGDFLEQIGRIWAGYPGGYKKEARGTQPKWAAAPFQQPDDPNDLRSKIWDRGRHTRTSRRSSNGNLYSGLRDPNREPRSEDDYGRAPAAGHLRKGHRCAATYRSHRWAVPVERDMTRVIYLNIERYSKPPSFFRRGYKGFTWPFRD